MKKQKRKRGGFTLLEVVLYVALFSILMGASILALFELIGSHQESHSQSTLELEGDYLLSKISWVFAQSKSITSPALNATSSTLSLVTVNLLADNPIVFSKNGTNLLMRRASRAAQPLNNTNTEVVSVSFYRRAESKLEPESLSITLKLSTRSASGKEITANFKKTLYDNQ